MCIFLIILQLCYFDLKASNKIIDFLEFDIFDKLHKDNQFIHELTTRFGLEKE